MTDIHVKTATLQAAPVSASDAERVSSGAAMVLLVVLAILALLGIYCAAQATDGAFQLFGACLAGFAILLQFRVISLALPAQDGKI